MGDRLFLAVEHPGIPDAHILHRIFDRTTLLVTNDRPLHNEVLRRGLKGGVLLFQAVGGDIEGFADVLSRLADRRPVGVRGDPELVPIAVVGIEAFGAERPRPFGHVSSAPGPG